MVMTGDKSFQYSSYENMKEYIIFVVSICQLNVYALQIRNYVISYRQQNISYDYEFWRNMSDDEQSLFYYYACNDRWMMHP